MQRDADHGADGENTIAPDNEAIPDQERARRIQALGALAHNAAPATPDAQPASGAATARGPLARRPPARNFRRTRALLFVGAVLCVVIAGVNLARLLVPSAPPHPRPSTPSGPRVIYLDSYSGGANSGGGCVRDVAWSPQGTYLALSGYTDNCPTAFDLSGPSAVTYGAMVSIYDAASGVLVNQFHPDDVVMPAIQVPAEVTAFLTNSGVRGSSAFVTNYQHIAWSPDGQRLAVTFGLFLPNGLAQDNPTGPPAWPGSTVHGVMLADATGTTRQVFTDQAVSGRHGAVWDVASGAPVAQAQAVAGALPPALGYAWNGDGTLTPQTPLNASAAPQAPALEPTGNPDGGASFTVWQAGGIDLRTTAPAPGGIVTVEPGAFTWSSDFAAWSLDGRYLAAHVGIDLGRFAPADPPPPSAAGVAQLGLSQAPLLPVRDAALAALLAAMPRGFPDSATQAAQSLQVAWSPSGRALAARESIPLDAGDNAKLQVYAVTVYDCASGKPLATLTPSTRFSPLGRAPAPALLRWSPDGRHLLLADPTLGALYIWSAPMH